MTGYWRMYSGILPKTMPPPLPKLGKAMQSVPQAC